MKGAGTNEKSSPTSLIGKDVVMLRTMDDQGTTTKPLLGQIHGVQSKTLLVVEDGSHRTEVKHLVVFQNGDKGWFDLEEQERSQTLTWVKEGPSGAAEDHYVLSVKGKDKPDTMSAVAFDDLVKIDEAAVVKEEVSQDVVDDHVGARVKAEVIIEGKLKANLSKAKTSKAEAMIEKPAVVEVNTRTMTVKPEERIEESAKGDVAEVNNSDTPKRRNNDGFSTKSQPDMISQTRKALRSSQDDLMGEAYNQTKHNTSQHKGKAAVSAATTKQEESPTNSVLEILTSCDDDDSMANDMSDMEWDEDEEQTEDLLALLRRESQEEEARTNQSKELLDTSRREASTQREESNSTPTIGGAPPSKRPKKVLSSKQTQQHKPTTPAAVVWVTVGKTEHMAYLLDEKEDGTKTVRWSTTGNVEEIDASAEVRKDYADRRRRSRVVNPAGGGRKTQKEDPKICGNPVEVNDDRPQETVLLQSSSTRDVEMIETVPSQRDTAGAPIQDDAAAADWVEDMESWLSAQASVQNTKNIMRQVRLLAEGRGIALKNWTNACFYQGVKVNLTHDFHKMMEKAKELERSCGPDKSKGKMLQTPLKKLQQYKLSMRWERD